MQVQSSQAVLTVEDVFAELDELQARGELVEATARLCNFLREQPNCAAAHHRLGHIFKARGQVEKAAKSYRRTVELAPENWNAWRQLGNAARELSRYGEALESYEAALKVKPGCRDTNLQMGSFLHSRRQYGLAIESFRKALAADPTYAEAHLRLGHALRKIRREADADECYLAAVKSGTRDIQAFVSVLESKTLDEAARTVATEIAERRIDEFSRTNSRLFTRLAYFIGRRKMAAGDHQGAVAFLASRGDPQGDYPAFIDANQALLDCLLVLGREEEAAPVRRRLQMMRAYVTEQTISNQVESEDYEDRFFGAIMTPEVRKEIIKDRFVALWPIDNAEFQDVDVFSARHVLQGLPKPERPIPRGSKIFTFGSCFASNVAYSLYQQGMDAFYLQLFEDLNTTFANKAFLAWLRGVSDDAATNEALDEMYAVHRDRIRQNLIEAELVILTVGVAPALFARDTGEYVLMPERSGAAVEWRMTGVEQNRKNLLAIVEHIRALNPEAPIVMTVSPVPLYGTTFMPSAVIADCTSKSTLRVAVHEVMSSGVDGLFYWPSFEIVRWVCGHSDRANWGDPDSRHIDQGVLDKIMRLFIERYVDAD